LAELLENSFGRNLLAQPPQMHVLAFHPTMANDAKLPRGKLYDLGAIVLLESIIERGSGSSSIRSHSV
jgi:hypothetical protein